MTVSTMIRSALLTPLLLAATFVSAHAADDTGNVDRGRYVATVAGCGACHDGGPGRRLAGGHVLHTPFGPLAAPNITPDEETGIGGWTLDDFRKALHQGVAKDGKLLYPAMPYLHYTKMRQEDVADLWAYLRSVPAVSNRVQVNRLRFPFDVRASLRVWRTLYFEPGRFQPDDDKSDAWNRGAYIVEALAHCGACHTPRDALGGPIASRHFQGARVEEWYAPDISGGPDSVIAGWGEARLRGFLAGDSPEGHVALGSMGLVVEDLEKVTDEDLNALVTYLQDQPPATQDTHDPSPAMRVTDATRARWKSLFDGACASCHGVDGEGQPGLAASLVGAGGVLAAEPVNVISVLLEGIAPQGDYGVMPSFRDELSDEQIAALANYVRISWGNDAPPNATAEMVRGLRGATATATGVTAAATCPSGPADRIDDSLRAEITSLADTGTPSADAVAAVVAAYRTANPRATTTEAVTDLGGTFCRAVAATGAPRATVIHKELAFMNAVLAQTHGN